MNSKTYVVHIPGTNRHATVTFTLDQRVRVKAHPHLQGSVSGLGHSYVSVYMDYADKTAKWGPRELETISSPPEIA